MVAEKEKREVLRGSQVMEDVEKRRAVDFDRFGEMLRLLFITLPPSAGAAPLLDRGGEKGKTGREEIEIGNTDRGLPMCDSGLLPFNDDV